MENKKSLCFKRKSEGGGFVVAGLTFLLGAVLIPRVALAAPTVTVSAEPQTIVEGQSSILTWTISGASSCKARDTNGVSNNNFQTTNGSTTITPLRGIVFYVDCIDSAGGSASASVQVSVTPVINSFTVDKASIVAGETVTFSWNATAPCSVNGVSGGGVAVGSVSTKPILSKEYTLYCSRGSGLADPDVRAKLSIVVDSSAYPAVSISGNGVSPMVVVDPGMAVTVAWKCVNATTSVMSSSRGSLSGTFGVSESRVITMGDLSERFTVYCADAAGQKSAPQDLDVAVQVGGGVGGSDPLPNPGPNPPACIPDNSCAANTCSGLKCSDGCGGRVNGKKNCTPSITSFTADQVALPNPGPITLSWQTANVASCTASGGWSGAVAPIPTGSSQLNVVSTSTFRLECFTAAGVSIGQKSVKVTVAGQPCVPDNSCTAKTCTNTSCTNSCGDPVAGTCDTAACCSVRLFPRWCLYGCQDL